MCIFWIGIQGIFSLMPRWLCCVCWCLGSGPFRFLLCCLFFCVGRYAYLRGGCALLPPDAFESVVCFMPPVGFVQFRQIWIRISLYLLLLYLEMFSGPSLWAESAALREKKICACFSGFFVPLFVGCSWFLLLPHWSSTAVQFDPIVDFVFSLFHLYIKYKEPSRWA